MVALKLSLRANGARADQSPRRPTDGAPARNRRHPWHACDVAAAAVSMHPVIERNVSGVESVLDHQRRSPAAQSAPSASAAPAQSASWKPTIGSRSGPSGCAAPGPAQGLPRHGQRLLHEYVLARRQRPDDLIGMVAMTRGDHHELKRGIVQHRVGSLVSTSPWLSRAKLLPSVPLRLTTPRRKKRSARLRIWGTSIAAPAAPAPTSA